VLWRQVIHTSIFCSRRLFYFRAFVFQLSPLISCRSPWYIYESPFIYQPPNRALLLSGTYSTLTRRARLLKISKGGKINSSSDNWSLKVWNFLFYIHLRALTVGFMPFLIRFTAYDYENSRIIRAPAFKQLCMNN
jgi:hypothetical protein